MVLNKMVYNNYNKLITKLIKSLQLYNIIIEKVKNKKTFNKYIIKASK